MPLPFALRHALAEAGDNSWSAAIERAWAALATGARRVELPACPPHEPLLVRWLYRHALATWPATWWPLYASHGAGPAHERAAARAAGGWLWLADERDPPSQLDASATVRALITTSGPARPAPQALLELWRDEERLHLVATDPALHEARARAREAWAQGVVCAFGPPGTGRASLLRWTQRCLSRQVDDLRPVTRDLDASAVGALASLTTSRESAQRADAPPRPRHPAFAGIIGESAALRRALHEALLVAPQATPVHLEGASGTGKELFARALHEASPRASGPFIPVNAATLDPTRAEADLLGWKRGAFTGADQDSLGYFGRARGGTLFLDEIADLPAEVRARLLRVLETGRGYRVGDTVETRFDVRIITASHRPLEFLREEGRSDLYQRLTAHVLRLPPLSARVEDIPALASHLLATLRPSAPARVSAPAMELLVATPWPDNVRQLANALRRATLYLGDQETLQVAHLRQAGLDTTLQAPLLVTTRRPPAAITDLTEAQREALHRGLVPLPSWQARGTIQRKHLVRAALLDREISDDALTRLAATHWPGELGELAWRGRLLAEAAGTSITLATLGAVHPDLFPDAVDDALWVRVEAAPARRVPEGALLLGPIGPTELGMPGGDARARAQARETLAGRWPDHWLLPTGSATLLLVREGRRVRAVALDGAAAALRGSSAGDTSRSPIGSAGFLGSERGLLIEGLAIGRLQAAVGAAPPALEPRPEADAPGPPSTDPDAPLDPAERETLIRLLCAFAEIDGAALTPWIRRELPGHGAAGARVLTRLESSPDKSQRLTRWFEADTKNPGLLDALASALDARPGARRDRLPRRLAALLDELDADAR